MAETPPLVVMAEDASRHSRIRLVWAGDIDAFTAPAFASGLREAWARDPHVLEVELSSVTFLDCAGLRPLVEAHARLQDRMRLVSPSPAVTRLLDILRLGDMFHVVGSVPVRAVAAGPTSKAATDVTRSGGDAAAGEPALPWSVDRSTIEQAKGLLMAVHGCDAPTAWTLLAGHATTYHVRIHVMAGLLVDHAPNGLPPTSVTVLEDVIAELARSAPPRRVTGPRPAGRRRLGSGLAELASARRKPWVAAVLHVRINCRSKGWSTSMTDNSTINGISGDRDT